MKKHSIFFIIPILTVLGCKKLTQVGEPVNTITTNEVFSSNATATAGVMGIYADLFIGNNGPSNGGNAFSNCLTTIYGGLSADELLAFNNSNGLPYQTNTLNSKSDLQSTWSVAYYAIYGANAAITALPNAGGVDAPTKMQLLGESKFLRAFCYFYLVNLFGTPYTVNPSGPGVPLPATTAYAVNDTLHRATTAQVYQLMVADLLDAQSKLAADYSVSSGQRIRVNQAGATALLARVYLYMGDYADAYTQANSVINNTLYSLQNNLNQAFLANSTEAILQWQTPNTSPYATHEGNTILPNNLTSAPPFCYLTSQLIKSFESGDKRKAAWVDSTYYSSQYYYFPYKYKVKNGTAGNVTENYMVLRLAEQYLIRAEAQANGAGNGLSGAISDLNVIRARAGLGPLSTSLNQSQVSAAVAQERKVELFAEWGHRWLDLKRTGLAQTVLSGDKGITVSANQLLYPIPANELVLDNNLVQNPGY